MTGEWVYNYKVEATWSSPAFAKKDLTHTWWWWGMVPEQLAISKLYQPEQFYYYFKLILFYNYFFLFLDFAFPAGFSLKQRSYFLTFSDKTTRAFSNISSFGYGFICYFYFIFQFFLFFLFFLFIFYFIIIYFQFLWVVYLQNSVSNSLSFYPFCYLATRAVLLFIYLVLFLFFNFFYIFTFVFFQLVWYVFYLIFCNDQPFLLVCFSTIAFFVVFL